MTLRNCRPAALVSLVLTAFAVLYVVAVVATGWDPAWAYLLRVPIHLGELAGVIALALSGAAGAGLLGRIGLGAAMLGLALLAVAEAVYSTVSPAVGDQLFSVAPLLAGVGMVLAGIAVLRAGVWTGWARFVPLVLGLWVFLVIAPVLIASGGPPATIAVLAIGGWDVCWVLLAVAVLARTDVRARAHATG